MVNQQSARLARAAEGQKHLRALGDQLFNEEHGLINFRPTGRIPQKYSGCVVAQQSLEYSIALLETGVDAYGAIVEADRERANIIIQRVLDHQFKNPRHHYHGNLLWMSHWDEPLDPNAAAFAVPLLVHLYRHKAHLLNTDTLARLEESFPLFGEYLLRREVPYEYTNIKVLTTLAQFLLGELLPDTPLTGMARFQWKHSLAFTAQYGLIEYNSPTYVPVVIDALEAMWQWGPEDLKPQIERLLEYVYFELAARYHAPTGFLTGAMSRAYPADLLTGQGLTGLVAHLQWDQPFTGFTLGCGRYLLTGYICPPEITELALHKSLPATIVGELWHRPLLKRTDYLGREYSLGSQCGYFGDQEVPLFASLQGNGRISSCYLSTENPGWACLAATQCGSRAEGFYGFQHDVVRSNAFLRQDRTDRPLVLNLHLPALSEMTAATFNGTELSEGTTAVRDKVELSFAYGDVHVRIALHATAGESCERAPFTVDASGERTIISQQLATAGQFLEAPAPCGWNLRFEIGHEHGGEALAAEKVRCEAPQERSAPQSGPFHTPQLHASPWGTIGVNELVPWITGTTNQRPFLAAKCSNGDSCE